MTSENVDLPLVVGRGTVSSWLRCSNLRLSILGTSLRLLILWLNPGPVGTSWINIQNIDIIESVLGSIISSENKNLIVIKRTTCVIRSCLRNISTALDWLPFISIVLIS